MDIKDLSKPITAKTLNERLAKHYGERLKLEKFKIADLKRINEKVDKKVRQIELSESFSKLNENDNYQKNKLISKILSKEIKERSRNSTSHYMPPEEQDIDQVSSYRRQDNTDYNDMSAAAKRHANKSRDEIKGKSTDNKKTSKNNNKVSNKSNKSNKSTMRNGNMKNGNMKNGRNNKRTESRLKNQKSKQIIEGEEDKAELIMATKKIVDKITQWMQDTSELKSESLIEIIDTMRDELGQEESESFRQTIEPALESLYSSMEETRGTLIDGVNKLTGENNETMGDDPEAGMDDSDMGSEEETDDVENTDNELDDFYSDTDAEEPEDEYAASDAAAGGSEEVGREKRESVQRSRRLASILTSESPKKK